MNVLEYMEFEWKLYHKHDSWNEVHNKNMPSGDDYNTYT